MSAANEMSHSQFIDVMPKPRHIHLFSTWDVGNERNLEDSLTVQTQRVERDFGDNVSFETCVHLIDQKNSSSPCELKVTVPPAHRNMKIAHISIMSEARVIELYGQCGEYLATIEASFLEECEEMPVYKAEMELSQPTYECLLKFVRAKRKQDIWLYGVNIYLQKNEAFDQQGSTINFNIVNTILKESGHQITEKADKCKKFLQLYRSTSEENKNKNKPDLQSLMRMFESKYLHKINPFESDTKDIPRSKCITSEILPDPEIAPIDRVSEQQTDINSLVPRTTTVETNFREGIQQHVEQCFQNLEAKLMARIEDKLNELEKKQNEKFSFIFSQLEKLQK